MGGSREVGRQFDDEGSDLVIDLGTYACEKRGIATKQHFNPTLWLAEIHRDRPKTLVGEAFSGLRPLGQGHPGRVTFFVRAGWQIPGEEASDERAGCEWKIGRQL